jgi:hypothetical protein
MYKRYKRSVNLVGKIYASNADRVFRMSFQSDGQSGVENGMGLHLKVCAARGRDLHPSGNLIVMKILV